MFWLKWIGIQKLKSLIAPPSLLIKRRYIRFQRIIKNYGRMLELLTDLSEKQGGGFILDKQYLIALTNKLFDLADSIVYDLNVLTREQHLNFYDRLDRLKKEIKEIVSPRPAFLLTEPYVIPFEVAKHVLPHQIGKENSSLLDLHHWMNIPVPEGFIITTSAYQRIIEENNLVGLVSQAVEKFRKNDPDAAKELLALQKKLKSALIPSGLRESVEQNLSSLVEKFGRDLLLTVEFIIQAENQKVTFDELSSYGEIVSNIEPDDFFDIYRNKMASLYDPTQVLFRKSKKMGEEAFLTAVCKRMIPGKVGGKLYTLEPTSPESSFMLLKIFLDNRSKTIKISRNPPFEIVPCQDQNGEDHKKETDLPLYFNKPNLSYDEIIRIATFGLRIERFFKQVQEIEWVKDLDGRIIIVRNKPLEFQSVRLIDPRKIAESLRKHRVIYDNVGQVACRGVAGGPVFLVRNKKDINEFPEQGVLVAPELLPEWEPKCAMQKASAILTDSGKTDGSVASLARRFRIPFIVGLKDATKRLFNGELLTIDADENVVYQGLIKELINYYLIEELGYGDELEHQMFQMVQDKVANLSFTNWETQTQDFNINSCQTIHDLAYLACENAIKGLIKGDSYQKEFFRASKLLKWGKYMVFQIIDIGDGLKSANFSESTISFEDIQSRPMIALGEKLFAPKKKEKDSSAIADNVSFKKKNFAVLSKEYLNLTIHLGPAIDMIDSYVCEESELNYIFCRFSNLKGEAHPRFKLAREVMQQLSFEIEETPIALSAWISQLSPSAMEKRLHAIGNLFNFIHFRDEGGYSNLSSESISRFF